MEESSEDSYQSPNHGKQKKASQKEKKSPKKSGADRTKDNPQAMNSDVSDSSSIPDMDEKGLLPYNNDKSRESQRETLRVCYPEKYKELVEKEKARNEEIDQEIKANRKLKRAAGKEQKQKSQLRSKREDETAEEYTSALTFDFFSQDPVLGRHMAKPKSRLSRRK